MIAGFPAPLCNLLNQQGINPAIGNTDRPLIGFAATEFFRKLYDSRSPRIQSDMLLRTAK